MFLATMGPKSHWFSNSYKLPVITYAYWIEEHQLLNNFFFVF